VRSAAGAGRRVVGAAIAVRFAAVHGDRLARLVLVDAMGLVPFEPDRRFGIALHRFLAGPTERTYDRLMELCAFDLDRAKERLGGRWDPYAAYAVELMRAPSVQAALGSLIGQFAATPIPPDELDGIDVPITLIWGRHDLATPLHVAEDASARYGWPLHVIEDAGDDPPLDRPDAFLEALRAATGTVVAS
jgi:pimeloyl-ACP methyl ester carboxylesterase